MSFHKLFDPGPNNRVLKKRDSELTNEWNIGQLDSVIRNKDRAGSEVDVMIYNCGDNFARLTDGVVNVEVTCIVHDMAKPEVRTIPRSCVCCCPGHYKFSVQWVTGSLMGVNTASKVDTDTDSEQLEFTTIFEKHTIEDEDSDVPVKFSELAKKDELYDVITSLETDFNLDLVEMFLIRHESYIFMTAWSCSRRLVPNLQVRINLSDIYA